MEKIMVFSPGRVNIIGEHIDYNGGLVMPMAIDRGTYAKVALNNTKTIKAYSINFESMGVMSFDYTQELKRENNWVDYVKAVFYTFKKHGYENKYGMEIEIFGNIPNSSGLSSSASIEVLVAKIINEVNGFKISDQKIATMCQEAENVFVGVNCGIMDQFIIANAKKDTVMMLNCDTLEYKHTTMNFEGYGLYVINSNKKRGLVDSKYNERREECEEGLKIIQRYYDVKNICDINIEELEKIKDQFSPIIYLRVKHVVSENQRVKDFYDALNNNDSAKAFNILNEAHKSISSDYAVGCEEIDFICEKSLELGASAARMTGAGFGGCCIVFIKDDLNKDFLEKLPKMYKSKFGLDLDIFRTNSGDKTTLYVESL